MDEVLPAVLLMGGGEGMGPIEATARALGEALYDENIGEPIGQILLICGRNKKLANKLLSINWKVPVQVLVYPFPYLSVATSLHIFSITSFMNFCHVITCFSKLHNTLFTCILMIKTLI